MPRPMKWHIFNANDKQIPLTWDGEAIKFDTKEQAIRFLKSCSELYDFTYEEYLKTFEVGEIRQCILYYDGGHLDLSNYVVGWDEESLEEILIKVN